MTAENLEVSGVAALLYGTNHPAYRPRVRNACMDRGWRRMVGDQPSERAALLSACTAAAKPLMQEANHPLTVRRLDHERAFEAVRIRRGQKTNHTIHIFSAALLPTQQVQILHHDRSLDAEQLRAGVQRHYEQLRDYLSCSQMRSLIRSVVRQLKGVSLGERAIYFLPGAGAEAFSEWSRSAGLGSYTLAKIGIANNAATLRQVLSGLEEEVDAVVSKLYEAASTGDISRRLANSLRKQCDAMLAKIAEYEAAFGQPLGYLASRVEQARQTAAVIDLLSVSV